MGNDWYVRINDAERGPISSETLKQLALEGRVTPETPLKRGATGDWEPAGALKGLFPTAARQPAPPPPGGTLDTAVASWLDEGPASSTDEPSSPATNSMPCPVCGEEILRIAKKCKHCGEWLAEAIPPHSPAAFRPVDEGPVVIVSQVGVPSTGEDFGRGTRLQGEYRCPACGADGIKRLSLVHEEGTSAISTNTTGIGVGYGGGGLGVGVGSASTTGQQQTALARKVKPPGVPSAPAYLVLLGLFCLVVSACSGVYIIGIVILVACFVAAKIAADASRPSYERNLEQWQRSFLCLRCGNIFVPQALAKAEMVEEQSQEAVARQRALEQARVGRLQLEHAQARAEKRRRTWASSVSAVQSGVRGADRLLLRLAGGAENVLLYRFLRVFTVGLGVILLLLGLSLAGKGVLGLVKLLNSSPPRLYIRMDGQPKELTVDLGNGITLEMVLIPAGEFLMGSNDSPEEKPPHRVRITKPFYLGKYEITQEQWQAVTGNNPSYFKGPKNPVERVSWGDCQEFIKKLNERVSGGRFSLPTEAQWEYACRAGSTARYSFGNDEAALGRYAWYKGNSNSSTHPAGEKQPNAWGLYDMHGNVSEWCADSLDDSYYSRSPEDDPAGPETGAEHVYRGGGWGELAEDCRSALRLGDEPGFHNLDLGLRVSLVPADK